MPGNEALKRVSWATGTPVPIAMSSITTSALDTPARRSIEKTCDDLALIALGAVALIAGLTFRDYGLGWDDYTHAEYADLLLRMYGSGFKDTAALSFATNNNPPVTWINTPASGGAFASPADLTIDASAFDTDGFFSEKELVS